MALAVNHAFTSTIPDDPAASAAGEVTPTRWNEAHSLTGSVDLTQLDQSITPDMTGNWIYSKAGALSLPTIAVTGAPITGGTATTNKPLVLLEPSGTTSTGWQVNGTVLGINGNSTATNAAVLDVQVNGVTQFRVRGDGLGNFANGVNVSAGNLSFPASGELISSGRFRVGSNANGTFYFGNADDSIIVNFALPANNVFQLGTANAASPVAQTLQAQGSRPGTDTNTGGANLTITSGNGTGTGAISSLVLQSPVAAASGTGAQTQTTGLTIKGGQAVASTYTVATLPTGIAGGMAYVTDGDAGLAWGATVVNTGAGATKYLVWFNGANWTVMGK